MKKMKYSLLVIVCFSLVLSCADESLDPLQFENVKKGTILALRGTQLENLYVSGLPGASFVPVLATGTEKFEFDAEFLSEDPTSLASMDIYAIKRNGTARERVSLTNVPFSQFKTTSDYPKPWVSVSMTLTEILTKVLGHTVTYPLSEDDVETLLGTYKSGINIEIDLNLTDGSKVSSDDLVAAG